MAARSTTVVFKSFAPAQLVRQSENLDHGIWTKGQLPPEKIAAGSAGDATTATFASESQGMMTGTEGNVVYQFPDGQTTVRLYWDNPYVGSNGADISLSGPQADRYGVDKSGGSGDNATQSFSLKAR